jgi:hypothetical protein
MMRRRRRRLPLASSPMPHGVDDEPWDHETYGALLRGGEDVAGVMKKMTEVVGGCACFSCFQILIGGE